MSFISNVPKLLELGIRDKTSSVEIIEGFWTIYDNSNYQGTSITLGPGKHNLSARNNKADSLKRASIIILYKEPDFQYAPTPDCLCFAFFGCAGRKTTLKTAT